MDELTEKLKGFLGKYRYVLLVLAVGVVLMVLPGGEEKNKAPETVAVTNDKSIEERLEEILFQIEGVGQVRVLLTEAAGAETIYRTDQERSETDNGSTFREETVLVTASDRGQAGLILQTLPPEYQGAVIVCRGADSPAVRLAVVEAVSNAAGIPTDRITVLKMK